jgi:hypothetical protein
MAEPVDAAREQHAHASAVLYRASRPVKQTAVVGDPRLRTRRQPMT